MNDHHFQIPNPEQAHGKIQLDFIVCLLADAGVTRWMVSPGSRNAPLVASMVKHGGFDLHSFPDERVAAFAALGAAQGSRYPVGVICTSGTAAANLYPAVCEAYYQRIPLLVLTADRPPELIDQWDGQTIHQNNLFQPHTQGNFNLPTIPNFLVKNPKLVANTITNRRNFQGSEGIHITSG
jgi:2-succinyl-5-enolpyruvyl-6-hydroxy-3-cyclohexene-1-carboxylate synthase